MFSSRGQHRRGRQRRGLVGSAGVLEQGKGTGWIAREPVISRARPRVQHAGKGARRLTKRPGLLSDLHAHRERFGEHEREEGHVEPGTESIKEPDVREREVVAPS